MTGALALYRQEVEQSDVLSGLLVAVGEMELQVAEVIVVDDDNFATATAVLAEATRWERDVEAERKLKTKPLNDEKREIDALFKSATAPLGELTGKLRKALGTYSAEKRRIAEEQRQAEIAALQARDEERRADAARLAEVVGVPVEQMPVPVYDETTVAPAKPNLPAAFSENGGVTFSTRLTFDITDENLVPRDLCVPDPKLIRALMKRVEAGTGNRLDAIAILNEQVPGVVFHEEDTTTVRTR